MKNSSPICDFQRPFPTAHQALPNCLRPILNLYPTIVFPSPTFCRLLCLLFGNQLQSHGLDSFNKVRPGSPSRIGLLARYVKLDLIDPAFVETRLCSFHALNRNQLAHPSTNKRRAGLGLPTRIGESNSKISKSLPIRRLSSPFA